MQFIIVDGRYARSRTFKVSGWLLTVLALVSVALIASASLTAAKVWGLTGQLAASDTAAASAAPLLSGVDQDPTKWNLFMRQNIDAMARKVGEMQARMLQLESLSERVSAMAGVPIPANPEKKTGQSPGQGGVLVGNRPLSMQELQTTLDSLERMSGQRADLLTVLESRLLDVHLSKHLIPTQPPVPGKVVGSGFGWRIDPITGGSALHTGLDFAAPTGSDILAAAGGVVVTQEFHRDYGNMVEVDHGNQVLTRYAHASRVLVQQGDVVRRGQKIAQVGTSGRSTGPHLHFEVWVQGVLQNPQKFLDSGDAAVRAIAQAQEAASPPAIKPKAAVARR